MKKTRNSVRSVMLATGCLVAVALLFSACKKNADVYTPTPVARLMAFNLAPDKSAVGLAIGGNRLTNLPLSFTNYTGTYLNIFPGSREVASYDFASDSVFAKATQNFEVNKYYSSFTLGANGTYRNVIVNDDLDTLSAAGGQAFVRYINAIPDSANPVVTLNASGTEVSNKTAPYAAASDFLGVNPGDVTVKVSNGSTISATRTITLEKGRVYTILLVGIPGSTDPATLVQIKFITNGSID